jgi:hypothetical protein
MLVGRTVQLRPAGDTVDVSVTVPMKPLNGVTVIVDVPFTPALTFAFVGLAFKEKSEEATL